ncbi:MAG: hypothetical protein Q8K98_03295 [Bacteroidota bacterium]|nr:hypothetical protein [Bacteroidota bacterium]
MSESQHSDKLQHLRELKAKSKLGGGEYYIQSSSTHRKTSKGQLGLEME